MRRPPGALAIGALLLAPTTPTRPSTETISGVSALALRDIPAPYLGLYQTAARAQHVPWEALAAIGKIETDHGRSSAPGVHGGLNAYGCCAGPMQFNLRNGPPSTWMLYGRDTNHDGRADPYDPADAIPAAARYLHALGAEHDVRAAIYGYNHSRTYVSDVLAWADRYRGTLTTTLSGPAASPGPRLARVIALATQLDQQHIPYCYGGGHITPARPSRGIYCWEHGDRKVYGSPDAGLDCSSAVSLLLQHAGYQLATLTAGDFIKWGEPGPGEHVTIWASPDHVYLQIDDRDWGTSQTNDRHGPGWHPTRSPGGFTSRHPPGL